MRKLREKISDWFVDTLYWLSKPIRYIKRYLFKYKNWDYYQESKWVLLGFFGVVAAVLTMMCAVPEPGSYSDSKYDLVCYSGGQKIYSNKPVRVLTESPHFVSFIDREDNIIRVTADCVLTQETK